jgi:hypothetical protein
LDWAGGTSHTEILQLILIRRERQAWILLLTKTSTIRRQLGGDDVKVANLFGGEISNDEFQTCEEAISRHFVGDVAGGAHLNQDFLIYSGSYVSIWETGPVDK